jgi:hypothetical protein
MDLREDDFPESTSPSAVAGPAKITANKQTKPTVRNMRPFQFTPSMPAQYKKIQAKDQPFAAQQSCVRGAARITSVHQRVSSLH